MNSIIEKIEKLIEVAHIKKQYAKNEIRKAFYEGSSSSLHELRTEILNEAVMCDGERNQTMCKRVIIYSPEATEVAEYCLKCKKEFDFFGKEIIS